VYVISGEGICNINGHPYPLYAGTGLFIPPGATYSIENSTAEPIRTVSACCPEDVGRAILPAADIPAGSGQTPHLSVHEQDREAIPAGKDRLFRILVHTDLGCEQITQFVGWIPTSKAPFHYHEYEEGIYILEGSGVVHTDDADCEFGPGSSVYFPQGVRHCVENPGNTTIKVLGAFYPSGSPGAAYEDH
jgi:mannose-6-phosphate isomerase-like protein (cupin superfamily)